MSSEDFEEHSNSNLFDLLSQIEGVVTDSPAHELTELPASSHSFAIYPLKSPYYLKLCVFKFDSIEAFKELNFNREQHNLARCLFIFDKLNSNIALQLLEQGAFAIFHSQSLFEDVRNKIYWFFSPDVQISLLKNLFLKNITLTKIESTLLDALLRQGANGLTRADLVEHCWQGVSVHHKTLDVHLFHLRKKLERKNISIDFKKNRWALKFNLPTDSPFSEDQNETQN